jgi:hypothetical protein
VFGDADAPILDRMASFDGLINLVVYYGTLALTVWAFVDAVIRPAAGFVAAGKLTKPAWLAITAGRPRKLSGPCQNRTSAAMPVIAAVVYLVDVRPAVRGLRRGNTSW